MSLLLAGSVALGAVYLLWPAAQPDPATASRQAVLRYLVVGEVATAAPDYQLALVDRLMAELAEAPDLPALAGEQIPARYHDRLMQNLAVMKRVWFYSRAGRYHELPSNEQKAFLDEQIKTVLDWSRFDLQMKGSENAGGEQAQRAAYAREFFAEIEVWIAEANADDQQRYHATLRQAIIRWLSTRDLLDEPIGTRQELAQRIVRELDRGLKLQQVMQSLHDEEQVLLTSNSLLLIEAWLHDLAVEYEQLPQAQRVEFIDQRLAQVRQWDLASLMAGGGSGTSRSTSAMGNMQASLKLLGIINGWIARSDEESRPRFSAFMNDLQQRWLAQQLGG